MLSARTRHSAYLRKDERLDFDAMDVFMNAILRVLHEQGSRAVRVFPPAANVLTSFSERLAHEVVSVILVCHGDVHPILQ